MVMEELLKVVKSLVSNADLARMWLMSNCMERDERNSSPSV